MPVRRLRTGNGQVFSAKAEVSNEQELSSSNFGKRRTKVMAGILIEMKKYPLQIYRSAECPIIDSDNDNGRREEAKFRPSRS
jgi:hypothetical protein